MTTMTNAVNAFRKIKRATLLAKVARVLMATTEYDAVLVLQNLRRTPELRMKPIPAMMAL